MRATTKGVPYVAYQTLDDELIDISDLSPEEYAFLERCARAVASNMRWCEYTPLIASTENPVVRPRQRVTREAWNHPLSRVVRDLGDRLGIKQGDLLAAGVSEEALESNPFEDELLSVGELAAERQVTLAAVYQAIERGDLIATRGRPKMVSRRSADRWMVSRERQAAARREAVTV